MAGLQSFIRGNQASQPAQPPRSDRLLYATNAKVSARTSAVHASSTPQLTQSTSYPSWNNPNPAISRDAYRPSWKSASQQPTTAPQKGIFDDTLSGLDDTESVVFDGRQDAASNGPGENDDYDEVETVGEDVEFRPERPITPRGGGISGRFYQPPQSQKQQVNMEIRPYPNAASSEQQLNSAKKRSRFAGSVDGAKVHAEGGQEGPVVTGNFDASSSGEDSMSDGQNGNRNNVGLQNGQGADYDDKQLESMTYKRLKDETWESETHGKASTVPLELHDPALSLSERFQNCVNLDSEKEETQDIQVEFFAKLPNKEWEEAGDLFIERFADIMMKLKEARQTKRKIATDFEKLIDDREAAIREGSEKLDKALADMRKGGEGIIRGKLI